MDNNRTLLVASMCYIVFFSVLNGTMFQVALPGIARDFALTPAGVSWMVVLYSLLFAVGSVTYGKLADLYPVKRLILTGLALFVAGSLVGFFAYYYWIALVARMVQALGAAAIPALVMVVVTRYFPSSQRGYVMGFVSATVAFGFGVGPLVGGSIAQWLDWHTLFLFSVLSLLALPVLIRALPDDRPAGGSFDFVGAALLACGVAALLLGVNASLWFMCGAAVFFLWFVLHIKRTAQPFIQVRLLRNRAFSLLLAFGFLIFLTHMSAFFVLPLLLGEASELQAGAIGLALFPGALAAALLSTGAGRLSDRFGGALLLKWSALIMALGWLAVALLAGQPVVWISAAIILGFVGFSSIQTSLASRISETLEPDETGVGMGLYNLTAFMGGAFGPTLFSAFLRFDTAGLNPFASPHPGYSNAFLIMFMLCAAALVMLAWQTWRTRRTALTKARPQSPQHVQTKA